MPPPKLSTSESVKPEDVLLYMAKETSLMELS